MLHYELADHCQRGLGCIRDHCMAAVRKAFEVNEMGWQGSGDVNLTFDWRHRILFPTHHEGGTLDTREIRDQVECVVFPAWPCEPLEYLWITYSPTNDVWIARRASVKRKCEAQPSVKGCSVAVSFEHPTPCHRADFRTSQFLE